MTDRDELSAEDMEALSPAGRAWVKFAAGLALGALAAENEACALLCEEIARKCEEMKEPAAALPTAIMIAMRCAAAIRGRVNG
jgi:hypothetical protein